ncbi:MULTISPECIES: ankyrin repeat protein [Leptospira]|uniref:ankyrin repeat protein n=1 Tax=Leptospira TaxID=171 RepID=UPI0002BF1C99|nr:MULTISPECIES: ankyrin repeat protein [Leptospira]EMK10807.1 ankyrin repeat protein [Leptospira kirschneri]
MTSLLLGQNANPNSKGLANTSPLIYAINGDEPNFEIVKLLIDAGADVIASETSKFCDSKWIVRDRSIAGRKWCVVEHPNARLHPTYQNRRYLFLAAYG